MTVLEHVRPFASVTISWVKVLAVTGNQVHIGIDVPREFAVYRQVVSQWITEERETA
jgi:carbon storage regulator CsrA